MRKERGKKGEIEEEKGMRKERGRKGEREEERG